MSLALLNQLRLCGTRRSGQFLTKLGAVNLSQKNSSSFSKNGNNNNKNSNNKEQLGQSTILVQQGCDIQELPVIVRRLGQDEFAAFYCDKLPNKVEGQTTSTESAENTTKSYINVEEVLKNIENSHTSSGIFMIIDAMDDHDLVPEIALHALSKLTRIETIVTLRNLEGTMIYQRLINCIVTKGSNALLLNVLGGFKSYLDLDTTIGGICTELLKRSAENELSVEETCEAINKFADVKRHASAEQFWSSLLYQERNLTHKNIQRVYAVLPHIKMSRRSILSVLDKKIITVWWQLKTEGALEIIESLVKCDIAPYRTMKTLSRWVNTNIHALDESSLLSIIEGFTQLNHADTQIEKALERYVKAKGVKIKSQSLVAGLLTFCAKFRIRNHHILNGCSEYFITNAEIIEPGYLKDIFCPFGYLDYEPLNAMKFWQTLETFIDKNFVKLKPNDIIDVMLACVYLEKFPINFVHRIFNPFFLDALHSSNPPQYLHLIRRDLKLFDTSLTLECDSYGGPMLPKDTHVKPLWQDGRIKRIINQISDDLADIAGGPECFSKSVVLYQLPVNELYIIDALFHPKGMGNMWNFNIRKERNIHVAVLVHIPEYYDSTGEYLIGPQVMRIRQMRKMGMRVVTLQYDTLARLKMYPKDLRKYLVNRMREALPGIPEH
ncbi:FAST kinase domain-containing protein 3, mitochondrial-like [Culicoides brevitarsis]|uniref:FAST kinase domain-containing protein 3, mitochondrial-like n=1 Tax=Culicoides brevitarsis TaxID=469753 RepID=UPI00307B857F